MGNSQLNKLEIYNKLIWICIDIYLDWVGYIFGLSRIYILENSRTEIRKLLYSTILLIYKLYIYLYPVIQTILMFIK